MTAKYKFLSTFLIFKIKITFHLRILKWTPFFDIRQESPIVPMWISFPNLRLHFFNPKVLHALGSLFGRPLQTDQAMAARTRPSIARVLVEVDITKKHAKEVWVGWKSYGYLQKVEFKNIPDFCSHCKMHGHASTVCFKLHPDLKNTPKPTEEVDVPSCEFRLPDGKINNTDQLMIVEHPPSHVVQGHVSASDADCVKVKAPVLNDIAPFSITVPKEVEKSTEFFISVDSMLHNNAITCPTVPNETQVPASTPLTSVGKVHTDTGEAREEGEFIPNEVGNSMENTVDNLNVSSSKPNLMNMLDDPNNQKKNDEMPFTMDIFDLDRPRSDPFWRGGAYSFPFAELYYLPNTILEACTASFTPSMATGTAATSKGLFCSSFPPRCRRVEKVITYRTKVQGTHGHSSSGSLLP
ncbi:hypothetical protein M5K25_016310 [Dendrobium thyrsiflorum]|uniref:DUF4283 domain-containing protein n=1 Tax=Dendrobium thyrsiflorum TaxID=117978 RepID=A0ABD0URG4_DENTH